MWSKLTKLNNIKCITEFKPPPPSSFAASAAIINVVTEFYRNESIIDLNDPLIYHRLIEAEKFAYSLRTKLGDIKFVKDANDLSINMTQP